MKKTSLSACPLFFNINEEAIPDLLSTLCAHRLTYQKNSFLYHRHDAIHALGIVCSGCIHILKQDYLGNNSIYADIKVNELFAESFALNGSLLQVDIMAGEDSEVLWIPIQKLVNNCPKDPTQSMVVQNLLRILSNKNQYLTKRMDVLSQRTTKEKVLQYLQQQAILQQSDIIEVSWNRQQLADYLCVERSALSTVLSQLKQDGLIAYDKNKFQLHQMK